jgi:transcriptional regulator with XRE-family HTH domain
LYIFVEIFSTPCYYLITKYKEVLLMNVGERIKQRRLELGLSQDELAKKVGYKSRSSINKIELSRDLPLRKVELMAKALDTTPGYLMGWSDETSIFIESKEPQGDRGEAHLIEYAKRLYEHYQKASPEIQKAVDLLLKSDKQPCRKQE